MVVDGLDCGAYEEYHSLTRCHACDLVCYASSECIEKETFERVIVESAKCVGDVEAMVTGVERCCLPVRLRRGIGVY